jgi:hypothetical protein
MGDEQAIAIAKRAYELWEADGRPHGRSDEYWIQAEREFGFARGEDVPAADDGLLKAGLA